MDVEEFRKQTRDMLDYVIHYFESISQRSVNSNVSPGYLKHLLPENAPTTGEPFEKIMDDVEKYIMPGMTHRHHPGFHAYFPSISSYTSILATLVRDSVGCSSFNLDLSPAAIDLEVIVADWFGKMIGLPKTFLYESEEGGGVFEGTVSECVLSCMIAARQSFLIKASETKMSLSKPMVVASLIAYMSKEAHGCVQKAAVISLVNVKILDTDKDFRLRGDTLVKALKEDMALGLIPFFVSITLGTPTGACDALDEIGPVCEKYGLWLNVDGSYAANACICPEYRDFLKGIEYATSFALNPAKWFTVHLDCSIVYAKDINTVSNYMLENKPNFVYFWKEEDYHVSNAFLSLKFWMTIRNYGIKGLQEHVRNHYQMAELFEGYVREDTRFEVLACDFGIVCFRRKGSDLSNKALLKMINTSGKLLVNAYTVREKIAIRFIVCVERACKDDMLSAWNVIRDFADQLSAEDIEEDEDALENPVTTYDDHTLP